jgi:membrane protein
MSRLEPLLAWSRRLSLDYQRNRASLAAGGLAYFVALSIAPAALAFGTFAGLVLDPTEVRSALESLVARAPGTVEGAQTAIDALVNLIEGASASAFTVTTVVSVLIAVYASSKVVLGLRMAMNTTFGVVETRGGLIERAVSTVITLTGLVLAVGVVIILTALPRILQWLGITGFSLSTGSWILDWLIVVALVYLSVRWVMHHSPNGGRPVPWASPGVLLATSGIIAATVGVGVYARFSASLGAAVLLFGTAVVILLWLYLCFVALLWGAIIEADRQRSLLADPTV